MNALNFGDLKTRLGTLIERNASSTFDYISNILNEAYLDICNTVRLDCLRRETFIQTVAEYTTGTVAVNSQSAAVVGTGTTFTESMIGRVIMLNNNPYRISAFTDATNITINRPYEDSTNLTGFTTSIFKDDYQLPYNCDYTRIWSLKDTYTPRKLRFKKYHEYLKYYPSPQDSGDPVWYIPKGYEEARHPTAETSFDTADTGTSTTSVVFTDSGSAMSGVDDYYNDWIVVNSTREKVSLVTDYVQSTKTITISPAITGQVATDSVALIKSLPSIILYPYPDNAFNLDLIYYKMPNRMLNDYDVPIIPHRYHELIYWGAAIRSGLIMDDNRRREIKDFFGTKLNEMVGEYAAFEEDIPTRDAIDNGNYDETYLSSIYDYPLGD